jgi:hypothetical protein
MGGEVNYVRFGLNIQQPHISKHMILQQAVILEKL